MQREKVRRRRPRFKHEGKPYGTLTTEALAWRSKITNGNALLPEVDGRSAHARRLRDLIAGFTSDMGGAATLSEAQKGLIQRICVVQVELEHMDNLFALKRENDMEVSATALDRYALLSERYKRLIESLGLNEGRKQRDITPNAQRARNTERLLRTIEGHAA